MLDLQKLVLMELWDKLLRCAFMILVDHLSLWLLVARSSLHMLVSHCNCKCSRTGLFAGACIGRYLTLLYFHSYLTCMPDPCFLILCLSLVSCLYVLPCSLTKKEERHSGADACSELICVHASLAFFLFEYLELASCLQVLPSLHTHPTITSSHALILLHHM